MPVNETLPRRFGSYVLTAALGEDALGRVYRALRESPERGFVRLRILESPEISEDAVLDAIQENGEIHSFLKNPAIARGVQMDSIEGVPFLAWKEESGRTLDALLVRAPTLQGRIPLEHSLLIAEKIATALDHAYNTSIEGERTLHGLVWPGFISLSDDGETCLTGFGLAQGLLASRGRPRFAKEIAPYLAPEERSEGRIGKNSDVYSVGVILFELLTGRLPSPGGPVADLFAVARGPSPLPPELTAVLKTCLSDAASRYQSSGELRRELGKLLFSGPYSPSTFNLAYFLNNLFAPEIEAETRAREKESALDPASIREAPAAAAPAQPVTAPARPQAPARAPAPRPAPKGPAPTTAPKFMAEPEPRKKSPLALVGAVLVAAAAAGTWFVISRRQAPATTATPTPAPSPVATATATPEPGPSTAAMSAVQFKEEVSRRVSEEVKKLQEEERQKEAAELARRAELTATAAAASPTPAPTAVVAEPSPEPTRPPPTATPAPVHEVPPEILKIVKPLYPPVALRARIGGLVILRVLVSETGRPAEIEVEQPGKAGLTEAAIAAVRLWTFTPARKGDTAVRAWTTVPIPFEP